MIIFKAFWKLLLLLLIVPNFVFTSAIEANIATPDSSGDIFMFGSAQVIRISASNKTVVLHKEYAEAQTSTKSKVKTLSNTEDHSISAQIIKKEKVEKEKITNLQKHIKKISTAIYFQSQNPSDFTKTTSQNAYNAVARSNYKVIILGFSGYYVHTLR